VKFVLSFRALKDIINSQKFPVNHAQLYCHVPPPPALVDFNFFLNVGVVTKGVIFTIGC